MRAKSSRRTTVPRGGRGAFTQRGPSTKAAPRRIGRFNVRHTAGSRIGRFNRTHASGEQIGRYNRTHTRNDFNSKHPRHPDGKFRRK